MMFASISFRYALAATLLLSNHVREVAPFSVSSNELTFRSLSSSLSALYSADEIPESDHPNRMAEFRNLEPLPESEIRRSRINQDKILRRRFARHGDDLWSLRKVTSELSNKLLKAINDDSHEKEQSIREQLRMLEEQDPELVYKMELQKMRRAQNDGKEQDAERHGRNAIAARSQLPQYNLDGLWVGKYGHHGYELINITYSGDTLIAYKVTGDKNVPRGEITFQVNLDPFPVKTVGYGAASTDHELQPISLTEKAAKKWGTSQLPRYRGLGQVAEAGFTNNQWMDGQLIIIGEEYFSFAWVPIEQQIFFGRPSPELALKMLRESSAANAIGVKKAWVAPPSLDDDVTVLKEYVASCLERTSESVEEDLQGDPFSCIWHGMDTEECYFQ